MVCRAPFLWGWACLAVVLAGCGPSAVNPSPAATGTAGSLAGGSTAERLSPVAIPVAGSSAAGKNAAPASDDRIRPDDWFTDATEETGIRFAYHNGREANRFYILESMGGGVAMIDFDLDGDLDLFFTGGGTISSDDPVRIGGLPSALFRNDGNWHFVDVTMPSTIGQPPDFSHGCTVTDFNGDGFPDLFVCCYGRSRLYRSRGDGTYCEAADASQLAASGWGTTAAFADFDGDGLPDLFLARYTDWTPETDQVCLGRGGVRDVCGPSSYAGTICQFFHNSGDGAFEDWSQRVGLKDNVHGLGVVAADLNGDGLIDFYVASDETPKHLYLGRPDHTFEENAAAAGVAVSENGAPEGSMGLDVGDYNGDGLPDIWVTNFENEVNALYRNLGGGMFLHSEAAVGLVGASRMRVGFGTAMTDFDGDGWLDLFVLNGNPIYFNGKTPFKQLPQLFRNLEGRRFENISEAGGVFFRQVHAGRGNAVGDLDNDGAPDLVTTQVNDPVRILRNRKVPPSYVSVLLRARQGEPAGTGARVTAGYKNRQLARFVVQGAGYFSCFDSRIILPVEEASAAVDVTVEWPGRRHETFRGLAVRRTHLLLEGHGAPADEFR
jgi:hypothetical protein